MLTTGFILGGSVGIGTLVYAFGIGPLIQLMIPFVDGRLPGFREPESTVEQAQTLTAA